MADPDQVGATWPGDGDPTEIRQRIRSGRRKNLLFTLLFVLIVGSISVVLIRWDLHLKPWRPPGWATVLGRSFMVVGALVELLALIAMFRRGYIGRSFRSPLMALSFRRRLQLAKQVRGRQAVVDRDLPLLQELAERMRGQRWIVVMCSGIAIMAMGQALTDLAGLSVLYAASVALMMVCSAFVLRDARRAESFLRHHPPTGEFIETGC